MDMSKYVNRVVSIDAERKIARVEPGVVLDGLQHEAAAHGLIFGPDPATHTHCTLGGMLGNKQRRSCAVHACPDARPGCHRGYRRGACHISLSTLVRPRMNRALDQNVRPYPFGMKRPLRISAKETMPVGADEYARTLITPSCAGLPCAAPAAIGIVPLPAPQNAPST